ncbi:MAG: glucose-1-phosphatase [Desulfobacteraceae bacterium Eth-SRB2]|nr:MAG: glucose-1-phosphatase [Desulfobacteraceae bacterium Eth-SRB2]
MPKQIRVLLFDIGGVLVELNDISKLIDLNGDQVPVNTLWSDWLFSPAARDFEMGISTKEQFADKYIKENNLPIKRNDFLKVFTQLPKGLYPNANKLIERCRDRYFTASLSNTNALHWQRLTHEMGIHRMFDQNFASHLTGKLKPDRESFEYVLQSLNCDPAAILFLDDNEINIKGARSVGMIAYLAKGPQETENILEEIGILTPEF